MQHEENKGQYAVNDDNFDCVLHRTVVLVGMMGSGKSAIGRALADRLDVPFLDSDAALEEAAALTIAEIFERDGEPFFRDREVEVIDRLLSGPPAILSTGGGAFLSERTRDLIVQKGVSVLLDVDFETLWERVRHKDTRPLLRTANPRATLADLLEKRGPIYAKAALHVSVAADASIATTTQNVIDVLAQDPTILERTQ